MNLQELRLDGTARQKKGLHFILASIFIWAAILAVHLTSLPVLTKKLLTFCFTAPLLPLAYLFSRFLRIEFSTKDNTLSGLGILFSLNQLLYLLIAMWVYPTVPEKLVMVLAMIFGAHLLPFGWLYLSRSYTAFAVIIPLGALLVGLNFPPFAVAGLMVVIEIVFSLLLAVEVRSQRVRPTAA